MTRQQLIDQIRRKKSYLCVGLDTDVTKIPGHLLLGPEPVLSFNKAIIDATRDFCVAYKINLPLQMPNGVISGIPVISMRKLFLKPCPLIR